MSARAMWKAEIRVGDQRVPVKMYAAARDTKIHFRLLHAADRAPVRQQMVDPVCDRVVPREEVQRGLELEEGVFVVLGDEEREQLAPAPSRTIRVEQLVPASAVDWRWYDRPYYLGPDPDDPDDQDYVALAEVLEGRDRVAIVRWVVRKKHYPGALRGRDGHLLLATMRHAGELVELEGVRPPAERAPEQRELKLAEMLVESLEGELDLSAYRNEYRDRVEELIEAKAEGRMIELPEPAPRRASASLAEELEASLGHERRAAGG